MPDVDAPHAVINTVLGSPVLAAGFPFIIAIDRLTSVGGGQPYHSPDSYRDVTGECESHGSHSFSFFFVFLNSLRD